MNYSTGLAQLTGRNRDRRKLANNTYLERREDGILAIRLHSTDIMLFSPNGGVTLQTGGWHTVTTKARMNEHLEGFSITQRAGQWYIFASGTAYTERELGIYQDDCVLHSNGKVTGLLPISNAAAALKLRRRVRKYAADFVLALRAGKISQPGAGDCFGCQLKPTDPHQRGMMGGPDGHVLSHIQEGYYVPSLLARAFEEFGASIAMKDTVARLMAGEPAQWPEWIYKDIAKVISRWCLRELGQAA